jgi:protein-L-isoaspartate(D-aspartate) O-methyltransferase
MLTCARRLVNTASHAVSCCLKDSTAIQVQLVDDRVSVAIDHVAWDRYLRAADDRQLPQTSKPELIATMLRLLDVQLDHRVLEVGTGSGYSTALLAHLVGAGGQVISLDIDPEMVTRASRLLALDGHTNVTIWHAAGRRGHPSGAPYDRLVAWAQAPHAIPDAWTGQVHPGGIIVAHCGAASRRWSGCGSSPTVSCRRSSRSLPVSSRSQPSPCGPGRTTTAH